MLWIVTVAWLLSLIFFFFLPKCPVENIKIHRISTPMQILLLGRLRPSDPHQNHNAFWTKLIHQNCGIYFENSPIISVQSNTIKTKAPPHTRYTFTQREVVTVPVRAPEKKKTHTHTIEPQQKKYKKASHSFHIVLSLTLLPAAKLQM